MTVTGKVLTVGYEHLSSPSDLARIAKHHDVNLVVDVRRNPSSCRQQEWRREHLEKVMESNGLAYIWVGFLAERTENGRASLRDPNAGVAQVRRALRALGISENSARILLLCYEDDYRLCHRTDVAGLLLRHVLGGRGDVVHISSREIGEELKAARGGAP